MATRPRRPGRRTPAETVRARIDVELAFDGFEASCRAAHGPFVERLEVELAGGQVLVASASALSVARGPSTAWRRASALARDRLGLLAARLARRPNATLSSFEHQLRDFASAATGGASEGAGPEDGLRALAVAAACRESERAGGRWIALA